MRSLIVEDDLICRTILAEYLSPLGIVHSASNGQEGLDLFRHAVKEEKTYDLICLDIMMPGLSGQEVLEELRGMERESGILVGDGAKIIMTTALDDPKNVFKAFRNECEGYLVKPIKKKDLYATLEKLGFSTSEG